MLSRRWSLWAALSAAILSACTLINQVESTQCQRTADCVQRGGDFAFSVCGPEGVCIPAIVETGGQGGASGQGGSGGGLPSECKVNADCLSGDTFQAICQEGSCVSLITAQCTRVIGAKVSDNPTEIFGIMVPLTNTSSMSNLVSFGNSYLATIQLAYDEYVQAQVPGEKGPLYVVCDEIDSPEKAADHLINTVKVKAIVGPAWSPGISKVVPLVKQSPSTVLWLPLSEDPSLAVSDVSSNQIWLARPNRTQMVSYWKSAMEEVEKLVAPKLSPAPIKSTLLVGGDSSSQALASQILDKTFFNQVSLDENAAQKRYFRLDYEDFRASAAPDYVALANAINNRPAEELPNLILILSSGDGAEKVVPTIEQLWPKESAARPYYLLVGGSEAITKTISGQVKDSKLEDRILSLDPVRDPSSQQVLDKFRSLYSTKNKGNAPQIEAEYYYDLFWINQYIFYRARKQGIAESALTLPQFAENLAVLNPPGQTIPVGPTNLTEALTALALPDGDIDLQGASSALDFQGNAPKSRGSLSCVINLGLSPSGVTFDPDTGMAQGTNICP